MTDSAWETLSNQAVGAAGVVYFLALLVHLAEWAALRTPKQRRGAKEERAAAPVATGGVAVAPPLSGGEPGSDDARAAPFGARVEFLARLGVLLTVVAAGVHLVALVARGMAADPNRVPWGNMYEFTLAGTFVVTTFYLLLRRRFELHWMAPIVTGFVLSILMLDVLVLHEPVAPLTEALNSYWLVIHVVAAVIATGAFTVGGILSVAYLVKLRRGAATSGPLARVPSLTVLDRVAYRVHAFAFPVWTFAVLIAGPIWAYEAWSRYWAWDPKEVWALITWVVYAAYLHARATAGWKGRNAALLAILGLATLWFNFIGINYFSSTSQHSYAGEAPAVQTVQAATTSEWAVTAWEPDPAAASIGRAGPPG